MKTLVRRSAPLLSCLFLWLALVAGAQAQGRAGQSKSDAPVGNPCQDPTVHNWIQQLDGKVHYTLYDGAEKLRAVPQSLIEFPKEIPTKYDPTCMVYAVDFDGEGKMKASPPRPYSFGRKRIDPTNSLARNPWPAPDQLDMYVRAGMKVLPAIAQGGFVHKKITPHSTTLIAVPLWREHALYTGDKEQIWHSDLRAMGYADAWKVGEKDGVEIYEVGRWPTTFDGFSQNKISPRSQELTRPLYRAERTFVVVQTFTANEPIIAGRAEREARIAWLEKHMASLFSNLAKGEGVGIDLVFYARGVRYAAIAKTETHEDSRWFPLAHMDPLTREPVERPVATAKVSVGRDWSSNSLQWELRSPPPELNSLAAIEKQSQLLEGKRGEATARSEQNRKEWIEQRGERDAEVAKKMEREQREAQASAARGLVYRKSSYWHRFDREETLGGILNGAALQTDSYDFMSIYVNYHGWFSSTCSSLVPVGSPYIQTGTERKTDNFSPGITSWDTPVRVRQKYWEKYKEYRESMAAFWEEKTTQFGRSTAGAAQLFSMRSYENESRSADFERLFNDNDCNSGLLNQLEENMHRLAHAQPTLQQASTQRYPYAGKDAAVPSATSSLADACIDQRLQSETDASERPRIKQWCRCADERAAKVLTRAETQAATNDFEAFYLKINELPKGGQNDPAWRYYDGIRNACSR